MTAAADALLLEIARCPNVQRCYASLDPMHPCSTVVGDQQAPFDDFHLPEPWSGQIEGTAILFVTWNPSWNPGERFPTHGWSDEEIIEFFRCRFDHTDQNSHTWREIRGIAERLLGRPAEPGVDYAVTDAVRCKSHKGRGASQALLECSGRYLQRTIAASSAGVVIALGKDARGTLATYFDVPDDLGVHGPTRVNGRDRLLVQLGAPGSAQRRTLDTAERERLRTFMSRSR